MRGIKAGLASLGIAAAMVAGVMLASPANAVISTVGSPDDYSGYNYSVELQLLGLQSTISHAVDMAQIICTDRMQGFTEGFLVRDGEAHGLTSEQAVGATIGGEYHFCHAYENDGTIGRRRSPAPLLPPPPPLQTLEPNPPGPPPVPDQPGETA
jgi:hypothetical protein